MPQKIIGIDIGSFSVKVAVIERSFKSFLFTDFFERRIQYNDLLSPEESTAIAIQGIMDDHNLSFDIACCGFPAQRVTSRLLTFPFNKSSRISQAVQFELESFIPFGIDDVVVDYSIVWQAKESSRVIVVYIQKKDLVRELTMLDTVGVDPRVICVEGVDLVTMMNIGIVPPDRAYALIDVGHEKTVITICNERKISYLRAVSFGGKSVTNAIAARLSVPYEEAEKMKIDMGRLSLAGDEEHADDITKEVSAAVASVADDLLLHIRQTFFSYRESEGRQVEGIYLFGGTSRLPGIDRYMSDTLKQNVTFLNCTDFHFSQIDRTHAHRHIIPQALAIALRGATGGGTNINMRRGEFAFKGDVEQLGGNVKRIGIVICLIAFLALINFSARYYSVKRQIDKMKDDVVALVHQALPGTPERLLSTPKAAIALIKSKETELDEKMTGLDTIAGGSPLNVMKDISAAVPPKDQLMLEVISLDIGDNRISMGGVVGDFKAVDTLKQALEKSGKFINITTGDVGKGVKGEVKFKLSMDAATQTAGETVKAPEEKDAAVKKEPDAAESKSKE